MPVRPTVCPRTIMLSTRFAIVLFAAILIPKLAQADWVSSNLAGVPSAVSERRNNVFYEGETVRFTIAGPTSDRYEVRNYAGSVVDTDIVAGRVLEPRAREVGWYKLYLFRGAERWGATTFVIFRNDPHFPPNEPLSASGGATPSNDGVMRGVTGMGPQRHRVDAERVEQSIARLDIDIAIDERLYLPFDPLRKRALLAAFASGTAAPGVRTIVETFKDRIAYWEPRNEPNYGSSGENFALNEMKPFYELVKSVNPKLKVLGPGTVSVGPKLQPFLEDFFRAGGARYIDGFSFHAYNVINGDLMLARKSLGSLAALLTRHGADHLERWQTEQGFFACVYGSYQPRLQGRWTMLEMMVLEQFGIPKEHNHLWYDRSHGYWPVPTWWQNRDGTLNPAAPLMRVFSEEIYATKYTRAFDFGPTGNKLFIGNRYDGAEKSVAMFQSAGDPQGRIELKVSGRKPLRVVSAWGLASELKVEKGRVILPVPELPVYVEFAPGRTVEVVPINFGHNLARVEGARVIASGKRSHPLNPSIDNDPQKIINGEQETWYWDQKPESHPWMSNVDVFPAEVEVEIPQPAKIARVIVFASVPWQAQSTLLDYDLEYESKGGWKKLATVEEPSLTFSATTAATRTSVDSFFSDRWIFQHEFPPVFTKKIRLSIRDVTWGGGATRNVVRAGGQTGPHQVVLREIEIYGPRR